MKTILQKETSRQLWESMRKKYQGNARVQRAQLQALMREFEVLKMKEGEAVTDYIARLMVVVNNMGNNGEVMLESQIVEKILRTLTERFNYIVVSIKESNDINRMTIDELQSSLIVHEQKFRRKIKEEEQVLRLLKNKGRVEVEADMQVEATEVEVEGDPHQVRPPWTVIDVTNWDIFSLSVLSGERGLTLQKWMKRRSFCSWHISNIWELRWRRYGSLILDLVIT